jgi:hypothetical protein
VRSFCGAHPATADGRLCPDSPPAWSTPFTINGCSSQKDLKEVLPA